MITVNNAVKFSNKKQPNDMELKGLSTDVKPTEVNGNRVGVNSIFLELDTNDFYYFDGEEWQKVVIEGGGSGEYDRDIAEIHNELKKRVYYFDNVASMKSSNDLKSGEYVVTKGYYEKNDGGGASYLIRAKTEEDVDDSGSVHFVGNSLVAELIVKDYVVLEMFGAKGNGINDDSNALIKAISTNKKVIILDKSYNIATALEINDSINVEGIKNSKLIVNKLLFNKNIILKNIDIDLSNSSSNIPLYANKKVEIDNISVDGGENDFEGLFIVNSYNANGSIIQNSKFINNTDGRCGVSISNIKNFVFKNNHIENIGSSAIELFGTCENCLIDGNTCINCTITSDLSDGVISTYGDYENGTQTKNLTITNNIIKNTSTFKHSIRLNGVDNAIISNNNIIVTENSNNSVLVFIQDRTDHEIKVYNSNILIENNNFNTKNINSAVLITSEEANFNVVIQGNKFKATSGNFIFFGSSAQKCNGKIKIMNNSAETTGYIVNTNNDLNECDIECANNNFSTTQRAVFKTLGEIYIINNKFNSSSNHMVQLGVSPKILIKQNVLTNTAQNPDIYKPSDSGTYLETPENTLINLS